MKYQPKQGDIIIANLDPIKGREQQGRRPVLIVSSNEYYRLTGLLMICPISQTKNMFPMHQPLPELKTKGAVLTQHIRTIDPDVREVSFLEKMPTASMNQILNIIHLIFKDN